MPERKLWEVLEVSDDLCRKVQSICQQLYDFQSDKVYLMAEGPMKLMVDNVMFEVSGFYDGYHMLARFLDEDGIEAVRDAVVGCDPYHRSYQTVVDEMRANQARRTR